MCFSEILCKFWLDEIASKFWPRKEEEEGLSVSRVLTYNAMVRSVSLRFGWYFKIVWSKSKQPMLVDAVCANYSKYWRSSTHRATASRNVGCLDVNFIIHKFQHPTALVLLDQRQRESTDICYWNKMMQQTLKFIWLVSIFRLRKCKL